MTDARLSDNQEDLLRVLVSAADGHDPAWTREGGWYDVHGIAGPRTVRSLVDRGLAEQRRDYPKNRRYARVTDKGRALLAVIQAEEEHEPDDADEFGRCLGEIDGGGV